MLQRRVNPEKARLRRRAATICFKYSIGVYLAFLLLGPYLFGRNAILVVHLYGDLPAEFVFEDTGRTSLIPSIECVLEVRDGIGNMKKGSLFEIDSYGFFPTYYTSAGRETVLIRHDRKGQVVETFRANGKSSVFVFKEERVKGTKSVYVVKKIGLY